MKKPDNNKTQKSSLLIWGLDTEVKRQFKSACAKKGRTMQDVITELIKSFAEEASK